MMYPAGFRFPIIVCFSVYVGIGAGISICGKIESGSIVLGDKIVAMPAGEGGIVKGTSHFLIT